ncbi:hypothetical protein COY25_01035 [Candidatus Uhrbacteria bacterium CG_4_10_14_0_2_um_filter_41_7]|uniref:YibE/F family protein n=1 Tax=Candidatus Uhrbacteria bacterium CG_4_9_14_3_um_filter_41_35 TaxID=1975034 RepID=A0A2M7XDX2_9BACT|nr:MAG: hypothetical protein COV92_00380 [Candidatus Uhrbacteria bacterium CG11_big_fil_rev_8_21_14_0_20_41_9]PIZ55399.1 MAG: hypothetical protein COY25_01035 [Candidatus Uhrbacteria bacterium CG_4_10_14_0_2_um_filter_41_7]PJA46071.1 MAG: hypothetical protein CO173_03790 [Candidatus Uhrbacteria bacterium CG_4_9_14_3_um_filter_41_35]
MKDRTVKSFHVLNSLILYSCMIKKIVQIGLLTCVFFSFSFSFSRIEAQTEVNSTFDQSVGAEFSAQTEAINENQEPQTTTDTVEIKGIVTKIVSDKEVDQNRQMVFEVGTSMGDFTIDTSKSLVEGMRYNLKPGNKVYLQIITVNGEADQVFLVDVVRTTALFWLTIFFAVMIVIIGLWRGLSSLLGLAITLAILFGFIVPMILHGSDAVFVTIVGSILILAVNMHLSHGFNKGTMLAFASTVVGLVLVVIFAKLFVGVANLSGLASEDAVLLYLQAGNVIVPKGVLLSAIILGAVGVLDDIAITQGETVVELIEANENLDRKELFVRSMRVGRHHIASTVNTLVLAYTGVALPLLLLFVGHSEIAGLRFINQEQVAEEIVRTLAGTMALVLTVPISSWFATFIKKR